MRNHLSRNSALFGSSALLSLLLGCAAPYLEPRTARPRETVDTAPNATAKGYVEFSSISRNPVVIPIYLLDGNRPRLLAGTGLSKGESYSYRRHPTTVAEKVRMALPPGSHKFMIEWNGEIIQVPVEADKVTPVQIDYTVVSRANDTGVYRLDYQMFEPTLFNEPVPPPKG